MTDIKLTQYSHGSGCGCKIAPAVLEDILKSNAATVSEPRLLVGNDTRDDAAVYELGNGHCLISTVDFFMPIVDDAFDFGKIAAANAISDVYAMGGSPILATAILGWPVDKLPAELARKVIDGAKAVCYEAGIPLAGGHSIDSPEPLFGLSVNGLVGKEQLKKNSGAQAGDLIYITKKIGTGILAAALKRGVIEADHQGALTAQLCTLNKIGAEFGRLPYVTAMTDITGFGILGHLIEMAEGAGLSAELDYAAVPLMDGVKGYVAKMIAPDNVYRNWNGYEKKVSGIGAESFYTLCDPQTNGGLMVSVSPAQQQAFEELLAKHQLAGFAKPIGRFVLKSDHAVSISGN